MSPNLLQTNLLGVPCLQGSSSSSKSVCLSVCSKTPTRITTTGLMCSDRGGLGQGLAAGIGMSSGSSAGHWNTERPFRFGNCSMKAVPVTLTSVIWGTGRERKEQILRSDCCPGWLGSARQALLSHCHQGQSGTLCRASVHTPGNHISQP